MEGGFCSVARIGVNYARDEAWRRDCSKKVSDCRKVELDCSKRDMDCRNPSQRVITAEGL